MNQIVSRASARTFGAACVALFCTVPTAFAQQEPDPADYIEWAELLAGKSKIKLYGYVRLDAQYDDSRFNDVQIPGYVRSEDSGGVPSGVVAEKDDSEFSLHARLTRLGAEFLGPKLEGLGNATVTGRIEVDFYNIGLNDSDSRNAIRMRRAYMKLQWDRWSMLAGQEWDLISPLYPAVNSDLVMWGAGNLGDRRPQLRWEYKAPMDSGTLSTTFGIGLAGAVASNQVVGGLRSGENSGAPMVSARVGYKAEDGLGVGLWAHQSRFEEDTPINGETDFDSSSVGIDLYIPLGGPGTWIKGEYWSGENLPDVRGGIFQGVNSLGQEIGSEGGFLEVGHKLSDHTTLSVGYSLDDPDDNDLDVNARSKNYVAYGTVVWNYGSVRYGAEYLNWTTEYNGLADGEANRVVGWIAFIF